MPPATTGSLWDFETIQTIEVYSSLGARIQTVHLNGTSNITTVDTKDLPAGTYVIRVTTPSNAIHSTSFVKQ